MKRKILTMGIMALLSCTYAQDLKQSGVTDVKFNCGTKRPNEEWVDWFNKKADEYKLSSSLGKMQQTNYTIPVIVHVIHGGQAVGVYPNISQAQINSQITVLNQDFAGIGLNSGNLASTAFSVIGAADCSITFCLAQKDTNGNILQEPGIERINYTARGWTNPGSIFSPFAFQPYMDDTIKAATIWDPKRYLNIWVSDCNAGLLGYSTFPAGSTLPGVTQGLGTALNDGLYCWSKTFGDTGTLIPSFDLGRTATHELGHYFGLFHVSGDANCGNDYCNDTPTQQAQNQGCPTYPSVSCSNGPNGDMFMNFMDYTDHSCMYMFTPDQNIRIQTAMTNSPFRNQLTASSATLCNVAVASPVAAFSVQATTCVDTAIVLKNQVNGNPYPSYSWSVSPSAGVTFSPSSNSVSPKIKFTISGNYTITMTASNSAGSSSISKFVTVNRCDVGISDLSVLKNSIIISPNPTPGLFHIKSNLSINKNLEVMVYNSIGEIVFSSNQRIGKNDTIDIDLSRYAAGLYTIYLYDNKEKMVERLVLSK